MEQCEFLQGLIRQASASRCLEVGLAYGISSLAICEVISGKSEANLVSIDPYQDEHWRNLGLLNLERAGFRSLVEFYPRYSYEVIPQLAREGRTLDFVYVDTTKVFDAVLVDASFLIRMLRPGGIIVFDDCSWPGIRSVVRYLATWPHLEVVATHGVAASSLVRRVASRLSHIVPGGRRLFHAEILDTNESLGVAGACVAFRKICEDQRSWDWSFHP